MSAALGLSRIREEQRLACSACFDPARHAFVEKAVVRSLPGG